MNIKWRALTEEDVCIQSLVTLLAEADEPVSSYTLALEFVKEWLTHHPPPQTYDPTRIYAPGTTLRLADGQVAHIARVTQGYNPVQGHFQILAFDDPGIPRLVASLGQSEPHSASDAMATTDEAAIEGQARDILRSDAGPHLRHIVGKALQAGERLVNFADEWWLAEKLPYRITWDEVALVRDLLREQPGSDGAPSPVSPADLVQLLWDVSPEDIHLTRLAAFTLNCALASHKDFRYLRAGGWVLAEQLPDLRMQRQPRVPRIRSRLIEEGYGEEEIQAELEGEEALAETLEEEEAEPTPEGTGEIAADAWQDLDHWRRSLAQPEARVLLRGQHYMEGFLPLGKKGLRRVIPPSPNEIELAWFLFRQPDNSEGRMEVTVDYRQGVVIGGPPLSDYLASQGILPGCYLYVHRRNEVEYDIYPRLLPRPIEVACKFVEISEGGELVTATETVEVRYEHDPDYVISETRLVDMEALWRQATELGLSFFDILVMHVFPRLAPRGDAVHRKKLWEATFQRYRMGTPQAIQRELRRLCFVPEGDGYYRFEPSLGYGFPPRKRRPKPQVDKGEQLPEPDEEIISWKEAEDQLRAWQIIRRAVDELLTEKGTDTFRPIQVYRKILETYPDFNRGTCGAQIIADSVNHTSRHHYPGHTHDFYYWLGEGNYRLYNAETEGIWDAQGNLIQPPSAGEAVPPPEQVEESQSDTLEGLAVALPEATAAAESEDQPAQPTGPSLERTRSGQLVATDLVPAGPLFDTPPAAPPPQPPASLTWAELPSLEEEPSATDDHTPPSPPRSDPRGELKRKAESSAKRDEMQAKTLFSHHYLDHRLPDHPEWAEDPRPILAAIRPLWDKARQYGDDWNEAQTEEEFIKPVLDILGWSYIVQAKSKKAGQITRPDYALFAGEASRDAAYQHQGDNDAFYSRAMAIGEAKYWERPLSQQDSSGRETWQAASNPSHQMVSYLVGTRAPWGILTNGRVWRLYSREVSSTASEFYEVDLAAIFSPPLYDEERGPGGEVLDAFKRFWLFFRRDAFIPDAQGKSFVQRVHEGSATYARHISDTLKELVFEEVMPEIAGGFVAYRYHQLGIQEETEESLRQIYQASLSLLYKLLFLLYAEARGLLPMANPGYREASLTATAQWAAERLDRNLPLSSATHATARYEALLALFHRIDQGDPSLGVPRYNGGLFNPAAPDNQFLAGHKLSDRAVARAVDILVRDAGQPVDYAYISVRNLGAIYEGLLENKLRVADAAAGKVELVNDKGERKASGSYYTPDYIVEYIVGHTLEPILEEREADFRAAMERCAGLRRQLQSRPAESQDTNRRLRAQLEEAERAAREAFLGIKVLDPAMGSGHFLVNAVDYLTDGVIQRMQVYHDQHPEVPWAWNPIQALVEKMRGEILAEMERQGIVMDPDRLDDTALLTRLVMKRCIYGVDLNPMAVELAKLSLWLHSFTIGAPLSFLDHHLRWGNSLIGSDVRTVEQDIKVTDKGQAVQLGLFAGPFAGLLDLTSLMTEVAEQADATLADVRHSAEVFDRFQQELTPYKQVLDIWVSQYFGNKDAREFLILFGADVLPALRGEMQVAPQYQAAIERARGLWKEKRFFHWDLEFPEIFVDLRRRDWAQNPGFDAVIGNPPYVRQEQLKPNKSWFAEEFSAYHGVADLYVYFYERGVQLLRQSGRFGMITSDKFTKASYGEPLRRFLAKETHLQHIVDFGHAPVFEDVDTFPCIAVMRKPKPGLGAQEEAKTEICLFPREVLGHVELANYVREHSYGVPIRRFDAKAWSLERPEVDELMNKIRRAGVPLVEFVKEKPYRGVVTGLNQAFLIDTLTKEHLISEDPKSAEVIKPYLRGQDIERWVPKWAGLWMIFARRGIDIDTYPAIKQYLSQFRKQLEPRPNDWKGKRWPGRKPGSYQWYEIQDTIEYWELFTRPKILYQEIQFHSRFAIDNLGYFSNNKVFLIPTTDSYLLALLNSPLMWWYNWRYLPHMKDEALSPKGELMETLPIASPTDAVRAEVEPAAERLITLTREQRKATNEVLDWLSIEFDVKEPGQRLRAFTSLDEETFAKEVKRRRPRPVGSLSPASLHILRDTYTQHIPYIRSLETEVKRLEQQLATLVNTTYGLTPEEVDLLWRTAPPRMPIRPPQ